jgi:hypothetical protein
MTLRKTASRARERWALLIGVVAALTLAVATISFAVHDEGNIQLDGDARTSTVPTYGGTDDWDLICKEHLTTNQTPGECEVNPNYTLPAGNSSADESQFITDAFGSETDDVYTTGGSKDDLDIGSWKFKNAVSSPDKADIEHAMAAIYEGDDRIVYFAADRATNNGDVNIAFWFFQDEVSQNGDGGATPGTPPDPTLCSVASGCGFTGNHVEHGPGLDGYTCYPGMAGYNAIEASPMTDAVCTPFGGPGADDTRGDVLIVSAFTIGGGQPNIQVYEWVGAGNAPNLPAQNNLPKKDLKVTSNRSVVSLPAGGNLSDGCATTGLTNDPACAIVNTGTLSPHPWTFTDKATGGGDPLQGEFFEGGLNLSALGFGDTCFASFLVDTRSSQSVDSVLHDFALGQLGGCKTTLTTSASLSSAGTDINNGNTAANGTASSSVDNASLVIDGVDTWGGELKYYICGPIATGVCNANGVLVNTLTVSQATTQPIPSGNGTTTGFVTLTSAGRYCWFASFTPDAPTLAKGVEGDTDDGSETTPNPECFTVRPVTPTLDTLAGTSPVDFGSPVTDSATLSGAAKEPGSNGTNTTYPTIGATDGAFVGTIGFTLKGPGDDPTAVPPVCSTSNASPYPGETQTFPITVNVTGNMTYSGISFTPNAPGNYHWVATYSYSGTAVNNNLPVTHNANCSDGDENVTVRQIPTDIRTKQSWFPNDSARIASSVSGDNILAGGTVDFFLYNNLTCTPGASDVNLKYSERVTIAAGDISSGVATVATHNWPGGGGVAPPSQTWAAFRIDTNLIDAAGSSVNYSWRVVYTPASGDTVHLGRRSACSTDPVSIEKFTITYTNDNSGGTPLP